ncbi:MAG: hypothetical protein M0Z83_04035 [Betaproteobacteria bacterium]|nr:hypothetical protein [Betaproteobacteria bacterium]
MRRAKSGINPIRRVRELMRELDDLGAGKHKLSILTVLAGERGVLHRIPPVY